LEHRDLSSNTPSGLYTRRGAIGKALRTAEVVFPAPLPFALRTGNTPRYHFRSSSAQAHLIILYG
jgi:hypothetical protein